MIIQNCNTLSVTFIFDKSASKQTKAKESHGRHQGADLRKFHKAIPTQGPNKLDPPPPQLSALSCQVVASGLLLFGHRMECLCAQKGKQSQQPSAHALG